MSRILKRPMFRRGGKVNQGIMSGLVDRTQYSDGSGFDVGSVKQTSQDILDLVNQISPIPRTRAPLWDIVLALVAGQSPIEALTQGYKKFVSDDDKRRALIAKREQLALSTAISQGLKTPKKGFKILTKKEIEEDYPQLNPGKAYKINLDTNDVIQIGPGDTNINMGVIKKQTGATDKEKKELGIPIQDDVVVQKDQKGNITDFKITSSADQRMKDIGVAVEKSKLQEADDALRELENYIAELKSQGYKNLPGIGTISGRLPGVALSKEGLRLKSLLAKYENITLKVRSGAAVTPSELLRVQNELAGAANTADESVFLQILRTNRKILEKQKKATFALYRDEDVKAYQERGGLSLYNSPLAEEATEDLISELEGG